MMENRLGLAKDLMKENGIIFTSIADSANYYKESYKLGLLMEQFFDKRFSDLIWKRRGSSGSYVISDITEIHEYIYVWGFQNSKIFANILSANKMKEYVNIDNRGKFKWHDLVIHQYTKEQRHNLFYGVVYNFNENKLDFDKNPEEINPLKEIVIYPSEDGKSVFTMTKKSMEEVNQRGIISVLKVNNKYRIMIKKYLYDSSGVVLVDPLKSVLDENDIPYNIGGTADATKELRNLLNTTFDTIKPVNLLKLLFYISSSKQDLIIDFFAGSGTTAHAVMKLNKEDGGKRKFIIVEMADYFDTIIIPRIKKVVYSFNWQDGKPQDKDGAGGFFKYQVLEQYEDSLDNIELKENLEAQKLFKDEYLLKYFLDFETRESPYLLNLDMLKNPFEYKLKVNLSEVGEPKETVVDIPETFAYLLGLKVEKIKAKEDSDRKYLFMLGEKDSQNCAIVFREYDDKWEENDFAKDKEFIKQELKDWQPSIVYVNAQCTLTSDFNGTQIDVRSIEDSFKRLMEATYYGNR